MSKTPSFWKASLAMGPTFFEALALAQIIFTGERFGSRVFNEPGLPSDLIVAFEIETGLLGFSQALQFAIVITVFPT